MNFWNQIKKPLFVLAPMADVTDAAFRRVIAAQGKPDVTWTEFVSADGLCRAPEPGRSKLLRDLLYTEAERPIVAQLFTAHPEHMRTAARLALDLGFDGVDINMGCPDKSIEKQGAGAALIKTPAIARAVLRAAKEGATRPATADAPAKSIPVSVKTRIGYNTNALETWLPELLAEHPAAVTIHARTRKELSKVPARWEHVARAVAIRNELKSDTLILGNGDVASLADARARVAETGCDGVMLGRAIFGNPWLFAETVPTVRERLTVLAHHTHLFAELLGDIKNFSIMKKHFKAYVHGWDGARELRDHLMQQHDADGVRKVITAYLAELK